MRAFGLFGCLGLLATVACGSDDEELTGRTRRPSTFDEPTKDAGPSLIQPSQHDSGIVSPPPVSPDDAGTCATAVERAQPLPLHLVVVLDKSGSMCEYTEHEMPRDCANPASKWRQTGDALKTFFADAASSGLRASLIAYPADHNACSVSKYTTPKLSDVVLPDTTELAAALASMTGNGATPTRDALKGAIQYAQTVRNGMSGMGKVAILMATDGYPQGCSDQNNIQAAANEASAVAAEIPVFVVGVGGRLDALNRLAQAGGTGDALLIGDMRNPQMVGQELGAALAKVRKSAMSCEYRLPTMPAGKTLDPAKVNVRYASGLRAPTTLPYSQDCSAPGWRYDDAQAPTKVLLCESSCSTVKEVNDARVEIVVGCPTSGPAR